MNDTKAAAEKWYIMMKISLKRIWDGRTNKEHKQERLKELIESTPTNEATDDLFTDKE